MKKLIFVFAFFALGLVSETTTAQVRFHINIATQPIWGPVGYDYVDYYYLPDIDAYYNVPQRRYVYMENNRWRSSSNLPARYRGYDLYNTRKVVMNGPKPYLNHQANRAQYGSSKERYTGQSIRDSRDSKYYVNRNHPEYRNYRNSQRNQRQNQR